MKVTHRRLILFLSIAFLATIPFFWLKPGQMDLGGDSSRLYFYDPINYLKNFPLYGVVPNGFATEDSAYYLIPFTIFLSFFKFILRSSYLLLTLFNSLTLVAAFVSIYGIVTTLLSTCLGPPKDNDSTEKDTNIFLAGVVSGFFYVFAPILTQVGWWGKALVVHNQFFLNPVIFFFLLKYILSRNFGYMLLALILSFFFAPNFFLSPYFFSFYPIAFLYLIIFMVHEHIQINKKHIITAVILFFLVHLFHLFPLLSNILTSTTTLNAMTFGDVSKVDRLGYFLSVASSMRTTNNLLALPQGDITTIPLFFFATVVPLCLIWGLILRKRIENKKFQINYLLILIFFLLTFFLATARLTNIGLEFYKFLFNVPGFSMFRNYIGQFSHVLIFFYALVLGFSFFHIFTSFRTAYKKLGIFSSIIILLIISSFPFIRGDGINIVLNQGSKNEVKIPIKMDPTYEKFLTSIRGNPLDAKYLVLPLDDAGNQVLSGVEGGAYMGPPLIEYLAGKNEFAGAKGFTPFDKLLLELMLKKDYMSLNNLLSLLDIRYIFYNSDPNIYDDTFLGYPYSYVRKFMPYTQALYKDFITLLNIDHRGDFGDKYHIYELDEKQYLPHIYIAKKTYNFTGDPVDGVVKLLSFAKKDPRIAIVESADVAERQMLPGEIFVQTKKENTLFETLGKRYDAQEISSVVSPELNALLVPLLMLPGIIQKVGVNTSQEAAIDQVIFSAENELKKLEKENNDIDSWKGHLLNYEKKMLSLVDLFDKQHDAFYSPVMDKVKLAKVIVQDQHFGEVIVKNNQNFSDKDKKLLLRISHDVFSSLKSRLQEAILTRTNMNYKFNVGFLGSYGIYAEKGVVTDNQLRVTLNGKEIAKVENQPEENWTAFGPAEVGNREVNSVSLSQSENTHFFDTDLLKAINDPEHATYSANLIVSGPMLGYTNEIINYLSYRLPNTIYLISFDYQTPGMLQAGTWKKYKAFVEADEKGASSLLVILKDKNSKPDDAPPANFKDLSIVNVTDPSVFIKKDSTTPISGEKDNSPFITFTRINPTRYKVAVKGATKPFLLVFSDAFNNNWKVFLQDKLAQETTVASFFNGEINEGQHKNNFMDNNTFTTWVQKPIADEKHYKVNGYANAWYIEPKDTNNKEDYTLVLEMTTQRSLYVLLPISILTVSFLLLWLFKIIVSLRKKV